MLILERKLKHFRIDNLFNFTMVRIYKQLIFLTLGHRSKRFFLWEKRFICMKLILTKEESTMPKENVRIYDDTESGNKANSTNEKETFIIEIWDSQSAQTIIKNFINNN